MRTHLHASLLLLVASAACTSPPAHGIESFAPGEIETYRKIDSLISLELGRTIPGAVVVVSRDGRLRYMHAFGYAQLTDTSVRGPRLLASPIRMQNNTMFDLASVTKVMATTMAVMKLVDEGRVSLDAPVSRYLPDFTGVHRDSITVRHLLSHSAGLVQWQPLYYQASNTAQTYAAIRDMPLQWGVGEGRHYSDLGFMLLGDIVERVSGVRLDAYVEREFYAPMGLRRIAFNPRARGFTEFAATEHGNLYEHHMVYDSTFGYRYRGDPSAWNGWRRYTLIGEVDDGNAYYANGGVAGHAGLFATASDVRMLMDMLLAGGVHRGKRYLSAETIARFLTLDAYGNYLGWMRPAGMPEGSFSHTGFTGTYVLGIPLLRVSLVLFTNKQNMGTDERGYFPNLAPLQAAIGRAIVDGFCEGASKCNR